MVKGGKTEVYIHSRTARRYSILPEISHTTNVFNLILGPIAIFVFHVCTELWYDEEVLMMLFDQLLKFSENLGDCR